MEYDMKKQDIHPGSTTSQVSQVFHRMERNPDSGSVRFSLVESRI